MKEETLQKFAELVERTPEVVSAEVEAIMSTQNVTEPTAWAIWKANNSMALRSGKPQDITVRILSRRLPEARTLQTGASQVSDLEFIYRDVDNQVGWGYTTLWGDRAPISEQVEVNGVYKARARFAYQPTKVKLNAFELVETALDADMPTVEEIAKSWEVGKLEEIENYAGNTELFDGLVCRIIQSTDGTNRIIGFEIANEDSLPITCWAGRGRANPPTPEVQAVLDDLHVGDRVLPYAWVNQREDGSISMNAGGVFKAK